MIPQEQSSLSRFPTMEVKIGNLALGGSNPIRLQSMTNTNTLDVKATIAQSIRIIEAGADYVRISAPSIEAAHKLREIKSGIRKAGYNHPLIADIHFNPEVALVAATIVEKIRINPGNYHSGIPRNKTSFSPEEIQVQLHQTAQRLKPLIELCKQNGTAIRIGTNMGSLSPRIVVQYGNTPLGMVHSTLEFLKIFQEYDFHNIVVSLKASKPIVMIQAYEQMVEKMLENRMHYPLHIGITEAGEGENGRIKSALGISTLLNKGIGDTLRVSLTEEPEHEIPFAEKLSKPFQRTFTQKTEKGSFYLKKMEGSTKELTVFDDNCKSIVIENYTRSVDYAAPLRENINYHPEFSQNSQEMDHKPDLLYCKSWEEASTITDQKFILPFSEWRDSSFPNGFPIYSAKEWEENAPSNPSRFFLLVTGNDIIHPSANFAESPKPLACIIDFDLFDNSQSIEELTRKFHYQNLPVIMKKSYQSADADSFIIDCAGTFGGLLIEQKLQGVWVDAPFLKMNLSKILYGFLQSAGIRITRTEFISCPTCARTSFDLQKVLQQIQERTSHIPGLKIAVMGCVVNGPGEMADADFGYVGAGNGKIHLYKGKKPVRRNIDPKDALNVLLEILKENGFE